MGHFHHHHYRNKHHHSGNNSGDCKIVLFFVLSCIFKISLLIVDIIMNVVISTTYNFNNIETINKETYKNPPLFQFNIGTNSSDYLFYKFFYTWQGTLKTVKSGRT